MTSLFGRHAVLGGALCAIFALGAAPARADEIADYFRQNCYSCHTIGGGRLTGPDLKGVLERKDRPYLIRLINNPQAMLDSGDAYALQLQQQAKGAVMPTIMGMTPERANLLLSLIEAESQLEESNFPGLAFSDAPFTPEEIARGMQLFLGEKPLKNGGANCASCHAVNGMGGLGGGRLGPDLTQVYERLQGRRALGAWLQSPATPTMQMQFKDRGLQPDEIIPLVAMLEDAAKKGGQATLVPRLNFFLLGLGACVIGLISLDAIWQRRFRAVRSPLVHRGRKEHPRGH